MIVNWAGVLALACALLAGWVAWERQERRRDRARWECTRDAFLAAADRLREQPRAGGWPR